MIAIQISVTWWIPSCHVHVLMLVNVSRYADGAQNKISFRDISYSMQTACLILWCNLCWKCWNEDSESAMRRRQIILI